jgi:predicted anti-sigma-YlaC factor YlaD
MKNLKLLNLNCREAGRLVSEGMDRELALMERIGLRIHLVICSACRAWRRQLTLIRTAIRKDAAVAVGTAPEHVRTKLSDAARERIRSAIAARP